MQAAAATVTQAKWQHISYVGNASHVTIYLNGESILEKSLGATPSNYYPSSFYSG